VDQKDSLNYTDVMNDIEKKKTNNDFSQLESLALKTTHYIGSSSSLIIHSILFIGIFSLEWFGFRLDQVLLILTTAVSLEAIYLAIFIQMTVNHQAYKLAEVSEEVEDISEDVEEISKDIDDIQEDVEEMGKEDENLNKDHENQQEKIQHIETILRELLTEVRQLKDKKE
jgi:FtsZ-binding cell division protein ZapB